MKKINNKIRRKIRNRKKLKKVNSGIMRVSVSKSLNNFFAQIIDDKTQKTIISASSIEKEFKTKKTNKVWMQDKIRMSKLRLFIVFSFFFEVLL